MHRKSLVLPHCGDASVHMDQGSVMFNTCRLFEGVPTSLTACLCGLNLISAAEDPCLLMHENRCKVRKYSFLFECNGKIYR